MYARDTTAKVDYIAQFASEIKAKKLDVAMPLVVYNLPERDCNAKASNGELSIANNGIAKYKEYIDAIVKQIKAAAPIKFILVIGKSLIQVS
jgi:cellulose 1,4-beta-cellobiosidase